MTAVNGEEVEEEDGEEVGEAAGDGGDEGKGWRKKKLEEEKRKGRVRLEWGWCLFLYL